MKNLKSIFIIGDSYSTFEGYIPEGNSVFYTRVPIRNTDVTRVEETWWHQLCEKEGLELLLNDSWSGSTIGYTGYNGADTSGTSSFIFRLEKYKQRLVSLMPDAVIVFGGTNDSWCDAPLGEIKSEIEDPKDLYSVCPAICYYAKKLRTVLPRTKILFIINDEIKEQIKLAIRTACDANQANYLDLEPVNKLDGHPTVKGMAEIAEQVSKALQML